MIDQATRSERNIRRACMTHGQSTLKRTEDTHTITLRMTHGTVVIDKRDGSYRWV